MMNGRLDLPTDSDQLSFLLRCSSEAGLLLRLIFSTFSAKKETFRLISENRETEEAAKIINRRYFTQNYFFLKKIN